jgi:hypothetical protein
MIVIRQLYSKLKARIPQVSTTKAKRLKWYVISWGSSRDGQERCFELQAFGRRMRMKWWFSRFSELQSNPVANPTDPYAERREEALEFLRSRGIEHVHSIFGKRETVYQKWRKSCPAASSKSSNLISLQSVRERMKTPTVE